MPLGLFNAAQASVGNPVSLCRRAPRALGQGADLARRGDSTTHDRRPGGATSRPASWPRHPPCWSISKGCKGRFRSRAARSTVSRGPSRRPSSSPPRPAPRRRRIRESLDDADVRP